MARSAYAPTKGSARRFLTGIASLVVVAVVGYIAFTAHQGRLPGTSPTTVRAAFHDVGQLQVGSDVRQNGVDAGRVTDIQPIAGHAVVTMEVHDGIRMYRDGRAIIADQSALAQKLVELRSGNPTSGALGDEVLPAAQTESTHDLVDLLDVFDGPTRAALSSTLGQVGGGFAGYGPGLHEFIATAPTDLADVKTISATLVSPRTDLAGFLQSGARLSERFSGREQQINELLTQTDQTLRALSEENGAPLAATMRKLPTALRALHGAMDDARGPLVDLAAATGDLGTGAHALGRATPDTRGVLREALPSLDRIPDVVDEANPAVKDLSRTVHDARPFTDKVADGLSSAALPLRILRPYGLDIGTLFTDLSTLISSHDGWEYRLRIFPVAPTSTSVLGNSLTDTRDAYPAPGQATRDRDLDGGLVPGTVGGR